nr:hypothetical protein [Tanacetum cinerariifolium]
MRYQKTPTMGYQKAPTPSTTRSWKKPNTTASKVPRAGLSNPNDITNKESITARDNGILKGVGTITAGGFSNNNNIRVEILKDQKIGIDPMDKSPSSIYFSSNGQDLPHLLQ